MAEVARRQPRTSAKSTEASTALNPALPTEPVETSASPPRDILSEERSASPVLAFAPTEPLRCHACRETGHFARTCPSWAGVCYNCHGKGHISRDCDKRQTRRSQSRRSLSPLPAHPPGNASPPAAYAPRVSHVAASRTPVPTHAAGTTYAAAVRHHGPPGPTHHSRDHPSPGPPSLESSVASAVAASLAPLIEALTRAIHGYHPSHDEWEWFDAQAADVERDAPRCAAGSEEAVARAAILSLELNSFSGLVADVAVGLTHAANARDRRSVAETRERSGRELSPAPSPPAAVPLLPRRARRSSPSSWPPALSLPASSALPTRSQSRPKSPWPAPRL